MLCMQSPARYMVNASIMLNSSFPPVFVDNLLLMSNWQYRAEHEDNPLLP